MYKYIYKYKDRLELYDKLVRIHLILNHIELTNQQINILVYFCRYGIDSTVYDKLIEDKIVPSLQIIRNSKTMLSKLGLIKMKSYKNWEVNQRLQMDLVSSLSVMVLCKL